MALFDPSIYSNIGTGISNVGKPGDDPGANPMLNTQTVQAPNGQTLRRNMDANGTPYFNTPFQNGVSIQYFPDPQTGEWKQREIKEESGGLVSGVVKTMASDPQFMGFLAAAAGGMAAAGLTGSTSMAALGDQGAAMTFGNGAGATATATATAAGAGAGSGAFTTPVTQGTLQTAPGLGGAGSAAGTVAGGGAGGGMFSNLMGGGGAGGTMDWLKMGAGLVNGIGQTVIGNRQQNQMNDAVRQANQQSIAAAQQSGQAIQNEARASGNDIKGWANQSGQNLTNVSGAAGNRLLGASQQAADMSRFTPYNISGGLAGATFSNGQATMNLDPRLKGIQDRSLANSQGFLSSVNAGTPEQQRDAAFAAYNSYAKNQQNNQFSALQGQLARQGLLGLNVNTQGTNGQNIGVNPAYVDFAEGVSRADRKAYMDSSLFGQQTTANQITMGNNSLQAAQSIDQMGMDAIRMGQSLGDSQAAAGARAGGFLTQGAQQAGAWDVGAATQAGNWNNAAAQQAGQWNTGAAERAGAWFNNASQGAAQNTMGRALDESQADAARNRNIWGSIWGNVGGGA